MRYIFLLLLIGIGIQAQIRQLKNPNGNSDSIVVDNGGKDSVKIFKPTIQDYRYKTQFQEAKIFDTAFSVHRQYAITQYNNRDNFGKIQFANIGSGFQNLVFQRDEETDLSLLPERKSHFILGVKDIRYYDVKTPTTSFIYHSGMRNGAALQSTYTQNFGKNFNLAVEYMGLRSQGFYSNSLAANNNFVASAHYRSVNQKYEAYAHYLHQNVMNQEYGGVKSLDAFLSGESTLGNRANLEVGLTGSDSRFSYRRYYFSHSFTPFNAEKFPFRLSHTIFHQGNKYYFNLGGSDASFFEAVNTERGNSSKKYSKKLSNTISLVFDNEKFKLDAGARYQNIILGAENPVVNTDIIAGKEISENRIGVVGNLKISLWEQLKLQSHLEYSNGKQFGNFLRTTNWLNFEPIKDYFVEGKVAFQSSTPTFNYLLNASSIMSYNYDFTDFKNENILEVGGSIGVKWFNAKLFAHYFRVENFTYFDENGRPNQSDTSLNISQIGGEATFSYKKFHLNTRLHFQTNLTNKDLFPVPNFLGRANFYYQTKAFKNAAEILAGIKVNYFTKFASRDFSPVLNEFILPNSRAYSIGGEPVIDAYLALRVKTMQIYLEGQNITTTIMQNQSYTAPYYPLYDFRLNIGIVWNMFH